MDVLDVSGHETEVILLGAVAGALWIAATAFFYAARHPAGPPVGKRTLELGPEPPAVANFLVHDFRVTDEAVAATAIDLAARRFVEVEQRGVGVFYLRMRADRDEPLAPYELRVLQHMRKLAVGGVVPAEALTTGPEEEAKSWRRAFESEVVRDAQARGLSRDAVSGWMYFVLVAAAGAPAAAAALLGVYAVVLAIGVIAVAILNRIHARHRQRETPEGLEAASRWLGVRAELAANERFATYSPLTVPLWDRLLAYGAALGVATGASRPLPMGADSDTLAWSAYGGRWRPVRIRYPRLWPPGWGLDPTYALLGGIGLAVLCGVGLYTQGVDLLEAADDGWAGLVHGAYLVGFCLLIVVGVAVAIMAVQDQWTSYELTGPILRLRAFGEDNDDRDTRYYAAVDDGSSRVIRAFKLDEARYRSLRRGQMVTVSATPHLGCLRWIEPVPDGSVELLAPASDTAIP